MPHRGSERYFEVGGEGTDDGACVSTYMLYRGVWGMLPPKFFYQIRCSEIAFEAVFVLKFILDSMPLEYRARVFLECHSPCYTAVGHW